MNDSSLEPVTVEKASNGQIAATKSHIVEKAATAAIVTKSGKNVKINDEGAAASTRNNHSNDVKLNGKRQSAPHSHVGAAVVRNYPSPFYYSYYGASVGARRPDASYFRSKAAQPPTPHFNNKAPVTGNFKRDARQFLSTGSAADIESRKSRSISGSKDDSARQKNMSQNRQHSSHSETCEENMQNGELEEPFSDSENDEELSEKAKATKKIRKGLTLPIPRRRIRTLSGMVPNIGYAPTWGGPTMCLRCFDFFDIPSQTSQYVDHLLIKHQIVIADIGLIVDLKRYIEHWRHRFGSEPIEKFFPEIVVEEKDPHAGKVESYFLLSEKVPEDRKVREHLAMRRLEEVLACQQRERDDDCFSRQCLFCRYQVTGNRAKLIHHLYMIHHLNLGSPDNLVFVNEYLDILQDKLQNGICIYCELHFESPSLLDEHMRTKGHREVNPENNYYDKFYMINYLELGKKWVDVLAEDFEDTMPTFADSEEEEEEESWNEWQENAAEEGQAEILCLFCDDVLQTLESFLKHLLDLHSFDLKHEINDAKLGFYDRVKFINYIRSCCYKCVCFACGKDDLHSWPALRKHLTDQSHPGHVSQIPHRDSWDKDEYLIPTFENDALLYFLDEFDETPNAKSTLPFDPAILDNGPVISDAQSVNSDRVVVVPEDAIDLTYTVLNDKNLREQLQ